MRYTFESAPRTPEPVVVSPGPASMATAICPVCREQIPWPPREDGTAASFTLEHKSVGAHTITVLPTPPTMTSGAAEAVLAAEIEVFLHEQGIELQPHQRQWIESHLARNVGKHGDDCERCYWKGRAVTAEAKVARVEAVCESAQQDTALRNERISARGVIDEKSGKPFRVVEVVRLDHLRAALDGDA